MPLCFAYGANMDEAAMASRCPGSLPLGLARLPRHRFVVTVDGYASVVRDPRTEVFGVLWDCPHGDIRALDRFEEVDRGLYVKISQPVIAASGPKRALVYIGRGTEGGRPRPGYLEAVIASALAWKLPEAHVAGLTRLLGKPLAEQPPAPPPGPVAAAGPRAASPRSAGSAPTRASDLWRR